LKEKVVEINDENEIITITDSQTSGIFAEQYRVLIEADAQITMP
jgi:hypothetical protein